MSHFCILRLQLLLWESATDEASLNQQRRSRGQNGPHLGHFCRLPHLGPNDSYDWSVHHHIAGDLSAHFMMTGFLCKHSFIQLFEESSGMQWPGNAVVGCKWVWLGPCNSMHSKPGG
jgi:hypothetical protein